MARSLTSNPTPPEKPLRIVVDVPRSGHIDVQGFLGAKKIGYLVLTRVQPTKDLRPLPSLPTWVVENVALRSEAIGMGYGTQLYCAAFAAAVAASDGPILAGAAADMVGWIATSGAARRVWERLRADYPSHPSLMAIVFRPEDVEPWMLPGGKR